MNSLLLDALVLAQQAPAGKQAPQQPPWLMWIFPVFMILLLFMWLQSRSQQKRQKKEREDMLTSLKPKDKVETIGGIFGTVVNVRDEDVTLRVDDSRDVQIKVAKTAIRKRGGDGKDAS
jgi:preprotein translocase subunit YajC